MNQNNKGGKQLQHILQKNNSSKNKTHIIRKASKCKKIHYSHIQNIKKNTLQISPKEGFKLVRK
jgi:hypothetical protein